MTKKVYCIVNSFDTEKVYKIFESFEKARDFFVENLFTLFDERLAKKIAKINNAELVIKGTYKTGDKLLEKGADFINNKYVHIYKVFKVEELTIDDCETFGYKLIEMPLL